MKFGKLAFKVTTQAGTAPYVSYRRAKEFEYPLPANGQPGEWLPRVRPPLCMCVRGYHMTSAAGLLLWAAWRTCRVFIAEYAERGPIQAGYEYKFNAGRMRLIVEVPIAGRLTSEPWPRYLRRIGVLTPSDRISRRWTSVELERQA